MTITNHDLLQLLPRAPAKRTTTEICERLARSGHSITARSVQRRLIRLSAQFPVISDERSKPFGWSITKDAPPSLGVISLQEAISLKMGHRYLTEALPVETVDDLKPYFKLADTKLKESKLYRAWMDKVRIISPAQSLVKPAIGRNLLTACYDAVLKERRLQVSYQREAAEIKSYEVDPLAIVLRGPVTYLVVRFRKSTEPSLLALHRIKRAKVTDSPLLHTKPFDLDAFIHEGTFGFFPEGDDILKVYFFDNAGMHLMETPFALLQDLKEVGPGEHILTVKTQITQQLKWWLLGFGERARVDGPAFLRSEFASRLTAAAKLYK